MATVRDQGKPAASAKYDAFVEAQLDRARRRIRLLDVSSGLFLLAAGTLAYALVVGLLDRRLELSPLPRQVAFLGYAAAGLVLLAAGVLRPLWRRVNPYYAAHEVERVVPGSKNSLVNWLDLHGQALPPAIRGAISQRAAKDLGKADLEQAISGRRAVWLAGATALLVFALFAVFAGSGPGGFKTLLARTFAPFGSGADATRTRLTLVRPVPGDAVLGVGQAFNVAVRVEGRVPDLDRPDALRLLYRYRDGEPYEEQPLQPEAGDVWMTVLPPSRTFNGFHYKVVGGDAETPEYRVSVRSTPLVERFDVTYHFRPYTGWADDHTREANLKALRGTEAELLVHTNRPVKEGRLEVEAGDAKTNVAAAPVADDPRAMRARLVLERNGQYRVWFTTTDNDGNAAATAYTITAVADGPPQVALTKPAADVTLPANGTLRLEGSATDDVGVKEMALRLRQADGPLLQPKPYRPGRSFRLADGGYPRTLDYEDFVALDQLKDEQGQPFPVAPGMTLEYWLEATDACDYPKPNRGESKHYKVTVGEPAPDRQQQEKERSQAAEEQKKHEQEQDKKLKEEGQKRQQEAEKKKDEERRQNEANGPGAKPDEPKNDGDKGLEQRAQEIKDKLEQQRQQEQSDREKGEGKGPQDGKGQGKGDPQAGEPPPEKGDAKPQGSGNEGSGKDEGAKQDGKQPDTGSGKPQGAQPQDAAGDGKGEGSGPQQGAASAKPDGPPQPDKGGGKGEGKGETSGSAAAPKDHGAGPDGDKGAAGAKGPGRENGPDASSKATAKDDQPSLAKGEPKPGEAGGEPKPGGDPEAAGAATKPAGKPDDAAAAKGDPKKAGGPKSELARSEQEVRQGSDRQSAEAAKRLEELARDAKDPQVRDFARKVLDDARKDRESSPALPKGPPSEGPPCECKGGSGQGAGGGKAGGNGAPQSGEGKKEGNGQATVKAGGKTGGQGREGGQWVPSATAQQGVPHGRDDGNDLRPGTADPANRRRAGVLQVDDFRKMDPNILKDLNMTPQEWEAFQRAYSAKLRRDEERLPASGNDSLGSRGAAEVKADKTDGNGNKTGLGQVPPEFRGAYRDYTRRQFEKK